MFYINFRKQTICERAKRDHGTRKSASEECSANMYEDYPEIEIRQLSKLIEKLWDKYEQFKS